MSNSIAPGSSAAVNVNVAALTTNPNVPVQYKTIILKKNLVNGVNTLTQEMMSDENIKYVIKYDYTLGEDITIPENCILEFDGGSLSNGTLDCNYCSILASESAYIFKNLIVNNLCDVYADWFGVKKTNVDNSEFLQNACTYSFNNPLSIRNIKFNAGLYLFAQTVNIGFTTLLGNGPILSDAYSNSDSTTILKYTGANTFINIPVGAISGRLYSVYMSNLAIICDYIGWPTQTFNAEAGIKVNAFCSINLENIVISGFENNLLFTNPIMFSTIENCKFNNCGTCVNFDEDGIGTTINFNKCYFTYCGTAIKIWNATDVHFRYCVFESTAEHTLMIHPKVRMLDLSGCYCEDCGSIYGSGNKGFIVELLKVNRDGSSITEDLQPSIFSNGGHYQATTRGGNVPIFVKLTVGLFTSIGDFFTSFNKIVHIDNEDGQGNNTNVCAINVQSATNKNNDIVTDDSIISNATKANLLVLRQNASKIKQLFLPTTIKAQNSSINFDSKDYSYIRNGIVLAHTNMHIGLYDENIIQIGNAKRLGESYDSSTNKGIKDTVSIPINNHTIKPVAANSEQLFIHGSRITTSDKHIGYLELICPVVKDKDQCATTDWIYGRLYPNIVSSTRPTLPADAKGFNMFDNTINKPIWWNGTAWVDATGATV